MSNATLVALAAIFANTFFDAGLIVAGASNVALWVPLQITVALATIGLVFRAARA